ncbi:hypothetical protein [Amycolatopsis sp. FDAARGOS 1241]|uniref:hypothetical protein n=1 Tax=Amycolatopsis sp. FDAARGOS 1241 TaxID=2778070 RepID=UPI00194F3171|nr:hypothetical protein [Amycolatopsis sp. FDAARGOS 1241]QRP42967.1 hypothetical protein I6J71_26340 [Amycolatopsis sp. FDAARGOS 1241]
MPEQDKSSFSCPHCGALTGQEWHALGFEGAPDEQGYQEWLSLQSVPAPIPDSVFVGPQFKAKHLWYGAQCYSCKQWSIWFRNAVVHPQRSLASTPNPAMPAEVQALYTEAAQVAAISPRAGAGACARGD